MTDSSNPATLDLATLRKAVSGKAAAFRCTNRLQPAGGRGTKVFPPTYEGVRCAIPGRIRV